MKRRKWSSTSSLFCQFITRIHQKPHLLILHRPIQCHAQPMGLVHVPAVEDARLHAEGANQSGVAFEIHDADLTLAGQAQILSGNVHEDGEPFLVAPVPERQKAGIPDEKMLSVALDTLPDQSCS